MYSGWNGLFGTPCKALRALFVDKRYINALFKNSRNNLSALTSEKLAQPSY